MKKIILLISMLIGVLCYNFQSCGKDRPDCTKNYKFEFPVTITPPKDTLSIGDTLWIDIKYSNQIINLNDQELVDVDHFDFLQTISFTKFTSTSFDFGLEHYDVIPDIGTLTRLDLSSISVYALNLSNTNGLNEIRFGIIPKISGFFTLGFNSAYSNFGDVDFIDPNCTEFIEITHKTNNAIDNNFELYKNNSNDQTATLESFNNHGNYAFAVIE